MGMAKAFVVPAIARRRGNPNWGRPVPPAPVLATEFESKFNSWDSRSKPVQGLDLCEAGVNVIKIDTSYQNRCSRRGEIVVEDSFSGETPSR